MAVFLSGHRVQPTLVSAIPRPLQSAGGAPAVGGLLLHRRDDLVKEEFVQQSARAVAAGSDGAEGPHVGRMLAAPRHALAHGAAPRVRGGLAVVEVPSEP